jgi:GNAT superfamily N-acetyltransferase
MVGYIKLGPPHLPFEPRGEAAELRQLYVVDEVKGQGVARELVEWLIERARDRRADHLYLSVFTDNHRARRFYEKMGFEPEGTYAFMVGTQADEDVVMRLKL